MRILNGSVDHGTDGTTLARTALVAAELRKLEAPRDFIGNIFDHEKNGRALYGNQAAREIFGELDDLISLARSFKQNFEIEDDNQDWFKEMVKKEFQHNPNYQDHSKKEILQHLFQWSRLWHGARDRALQHCTTRNPIFFGAYGNNPYYDGRGAPANVVLHEARLEEDAVLAHFHLNQSLEHHFQHAYGMDKSDVLALMNARQDASSRASMSRGAYIFTWLASYINEFASIRQLAHHTVWKRATGIVGQNRIRFYRNRVPIEQPSHDAYRAFVATTNSLVKDYNNHHCINRTTFDILRNQILDLNRQVRTTRILKVDGVNATPVPPNTSLDVQIQSRLDHFPAETASRNINHPPARLYCDTTNWPPPQPPHDHDDDDDDDNDDGADGGNGPVTPAPDPNTSNAGSRAVAGQISTTTPTTENRRIFRPPKRQNRTTPDTSATLNSPPQTSSTPTPSRKRTRTAGTDTALGQLVSGVVKGLYRMTFTGPGDNGAPPVVVEVTGREITGTPSGACKRRKVDPADNMGS
ncbi:uncharacterized protein JN550_003123 [Neoarthrinium moseri]|uniref:uncharacterized protein n=1 Tax=Neoarthrinium moseri TaxID=1658444 RepID=UPI001FDD333A|nr:uncharacterized protein JN550_003123 [Neoarthrinium moseri]KAI1873854.1 hypothetical protein JN550_003123 [Neoarthrinium moseri]